MHHTLISSLATKTDDLNEPLKPIVAIHGCIPQHSTQKEMATQHNTHPSCDKPQMRIWFLYPFYMQMMKFFFSTPPFQT